MVDLVHRFSFWGDFVLFALVVTVSVFHRRHNPYADKVKWIPGSGRVILPELGFTSAETPHQVPPSPHASTNQVLDEFCRLVPSHQGGPRSLVVEPLNDLVQWPYCV